VVQRAIGACCAAAAKKIGRGTLCSVQHCLLLLLLAATGPVEEAAVVMEHSHHADDRWEGGGMGIDGVEDS
jgi:hypothetical protein